MYYPVSADSEYIPSTFWNPLDAFGGVLSDENYTVDITAPGPGNGNNHPSAGVENCILFNSGSWYWEVPVELCPAGGVNPHLTFGIRQSMQGLGPKNNNVSSAALYSPGPSTIPNIAYWVDTSGGVAIGEEGNHLTVTTTGTSFFVAGDVLMFAFNVATGKLWIGLNGTWFNSGDPAAGTGEQFSGFDTALQGGPFSWRFFYTGAFVVDNPIRFHGAFGNSLFPQAYAAPAGFTALLPPSSADYFSAWNPNNSSLSGSTGINFTGAFMGDNNWQVMGSLFVGNPTMALYSSPRLQPDGKYYWEATCNVSVTSTYVGISDLLTQISPNDSIGNKCLWKNDGTLYDGDASITMDTTGVTSFATTDRLKFAFDGPAGKMWIGNVASGFFNSGDPAAGTNPQFSNIPADIVWQFMWMIAGNSKSVTMHPPADFTGVTPTGFKKGIPLAVAAV